MLIEKCVYETIQNHKKRGTPGLLLECRQFFLGDYLFSFAYAC